MTATRTPDLRVSPLTVPYLGMLASLQLIDPSGANIALVKASDALQMHGPTLALGASVSTLAQAASVLVMGFLGDRFGRRRVLAASLLLALIGNLSSMLAPDAGVFLLGRALTGIALGSVLAGTFASVRFVAPPARLSTALGLWKPADCGWLHKRLTDRWLDGLAPLASRLPARSADLQRRFAAAADAAAADACQPCTQA
ncbi:MAG: MFS transporter [Prochlorococcus sp.]